MARALPRGVWRRARRVRARACPPGQLRHGWTRCARPRGRRTQRAPPCRPGVQQSLDSSCCELGAGDILGAWPRPSDGRCAVGRDPAEGSASPRSGYTAAWLPRRRPGSGGRAPARSPRSRRSGLPLPRLRADVRRASCRRRRRGTKGPTAIGEAGRAWAPDHGPRPRGPITSALRVAPRPGGLRTEARDDNRPEGAQGRTRRHLPCAEADAVEGQDGEQDRR